MPHHNVPFYSTWTYASGDFSNSRMDLMFVNSSMPYRESSRPIPLFLTPPNGIRGSDVSLGTHRVSNLERSGLGYETVQKLVGDRLRDEEPFSAYATLSVVDESSSHRAGRCSL